MAYVAYDMARNWDSAGVRPKTSDSFNSIYERLEFLNKRHYSQYLPTDQAPDFLTRFSRWLENVTGDKERRALFELAPQLIFFGVDEFTKLYQAAFHGPITRWIVDELSLRFDDHQLSQTLRSELGGHTWYCPITDSMQISDFHHANNLGGADHRPQFRWLGELADEDRIRDLLSSSLPPDVRQNLPTALRGHIQAHVRKLMDDHRDARRQSQPLRRIVLLEDFVGVGSQIETAVSFAATLQPPVPVLFVPLIICPAGDTLAKAVVADYPNARYSPMVKLSEDLLINCISSLQPSSLEEAVRDLAFATYSQVQGDGSAGPRPYSPFGFGATGATMVMYSNTPANTLPIIHHKSTTWEALFPRSARIR